MKLIVISTSQCLVLNLSPCLPSVEFGLVQLLCNWMHSPPFAVEVLYSQKPLAILRVCLLSLAFILFPGYLISVLPLRESAWGRERLLLIQHVSAFLCI